MRIILNRKTLEPALVQVTYSDSSVRGVIPLRVSEADPTHKLRQIAIGARPQEQMPVLCEALHYVELSVFIIVPPVIP